MAFDAACSSSATDVAAASSPAKSSKYVRELRAIGSSVTAPSWRHSSTWRSVSSAHHWSSHTPTATMVASDSQRISRSGNAQGLPILRMALTTFGSGVPAWLKLAVRLSRIRSASLGAGGGGPSTAAWAAAATSAPGAAKRPAKTAA